MSGEDTVQAERSMDRCRFGIDRGTRFCELLLELLASIDLQATANRRLADINRVAASDLLP